jgi:hypothetical protein
LYAGQLSVRGLRFQEQYRVGTGGFAPVMVPWQIMRSTSARMNQADCMEGCAGAR